MTTRVSVDNPMRQFSCWSPAGRALAICMVAAAGSVNLRADPSLAQPPSSAGLQHTESSQSAAAVPATPAADMTFLENGFVRVGFDLSRGGSMTFIATSEHPSNIVNNADLGRQVQMSHYSGPWPFEPPGKPPHANWAHLGWNPVQTGDCRLNPAKIVEHRSDGHEVYIRCAPMQWPLDDVPADCVFETWTTLDGPLIRMRFRCTNHRADTTSYRPCSQELPAVYTISRLSRLISYIGEHPFTEGELTQVKNDWREPWPWTALTATEGWAALVDEHGWGLGVFNDDGAEFHGGVYGDERSDDPQNGSTSYVAPIQHETFDHNIVYEYETTMTVGRLAEIRGRFNELATKTPPHWRFSADRRHWTLSGAKDRGLPLKGAWQIDLADELPRLIGPLRCWRAEDASIVELSVEYAGRPTQGRLLWQRLGDAGFDPARSVTFDLIPSATSRTYRVDLSSAPLYSGLVTRLAVEPVSVAQPGGGIAVSHIAVTSEKDTPAAP